MDWDEFNDDHDFDLADNIMDYDVDSTDEDETSLQWGSFRHRHHRRHCTNGAVGTVNSTNAEADADGIAGPAALADTRPATTQPTKPLSP